MIYPPHWSMWCFHHNMGGEVLVLVLQVKGGKLYITTASLIYFSIKLLVPYLIKHILQFNLLCFFQQHMMYEFCKLQKIIAYLIFMPIFPFCLILFQTSLLKTIYSLNFVKHRIIVQNKKLMILIEITSCMPNLNGSLYIPS